MTKFPKKVQKWQFARPDPVDEKWRFAVSDPVDVTPSMLRATLIKSRAFRAYIDKSLPTEFCTKLACLS